MALVPVELRGITPTDEDCAHWSEDLQIAITDEDVAAAGKLVDFDLLGRIATESDDDSKRFRQFRVGFLLGVRTRANLPKSLFGHIVKDIGNGGDYRMLRIRRNGPDVRAVFRHLAAEGGVMYYEFKLLKDASDRTRAVDIYNYYGAEWTSASIRRMFLAAAAGVSDAPGDQKFAQQNDYVRHAPKLVAMRRHFDAGEFDLCLKVYNNLPESLKKEKSILFARLAAVISSGDNEQYLKVLKEAREILPNDPAFDLISIDAHTLNKEYDKAIACIDSVDRAVGGDPSLNVMRCGIRIAQAKYNDARTLAEKAITEEPDLYDAHYALVTVSLKERKFQEVASRLTDLEIEFEADLSEIESDPEYAEFIQSPEYAAWLKARKDAAELK